MSDDKTKPAISASAEAVALTKDSFVFDCLSLFYILDDKYAERALAGGVNATNVTFGAETDWDGMIANIEKGLQAIEKSPYLMLAKTADDCLKAKAAGKLAVVMGTQGSMMVDRYLHRVELMARLGLRFFGLAYTGATLFADGCGELRDAGVSFIGQELIDAVNRQPLLLDLSHCGHRTRAEGTKLARAPVCTHSNAYAVNANDRNTKDETVKAIVAKGGAIGVCGLPKSVKPKNPTVGDMLDHCDHFARLVGDRHVGIGLDFTEAYKAKGEILPESRRWRTYRPDIFGTVDEFLTQSYPQGLSTILDLPNYTQGLMDRQYSKESIAGMLGGNWLRVIREKIG
jgi:membrane dipeptidase